MGSNPAGTQHCEQSSGLVHWLPRLPQTQQAMDQAQALWPGAKQMVANKRMDMKLQHVRKVHQCVSNRGRRQTATSVQKVYPGKISNSTNCCCPRDWAEKGLEISTPKQQELMAPG